MEGQQVFNYVVPNSQEPGYTPIYRRNGQTQLATTPPGDNCKTVRDIYDRCLNKFGDKVGMGQIIVTPDKDQNGNDIEKRTVKQYTYKQIYEYADSLGKALHDRKLPFKESERGMNIVGIYSKNRLEWYITDWACALFGFTVSPLYDTLGKQNLQYCIDFCGMTTAFVSAKTAAAIQQFDTKGSLKTLVCYDEIDEELKKKLNEKGIQVLGYWQLIEEGKKSSTKHEDIEIKGSDIFSFCYTSGTTGPPKGALISNANMMACTAGFVDHQQIKFKTQDRYLSTLPLPHLFQRSVSISMFYVGAQLVVSSGNMLKLKEDHIAVKSTVVVSVPRVYNKIYEGIKALIDGMVKGEEAKRGPVEAGVFPKFRLGFGGCIRMMLTGSAPINPVVQNYLQRAMGCPFLQGYGQTESPVALLLGRSSQNYNGAMHQIGAGAQLRLQDIPEMKYTSADKNKEGKPTPRGQLIARGPQVFAGYYKRDDLNKQTVVDGWLHTGDVAEVDENLCFKIIDRKKNIFKLQQGQYVAPDTVEAVYLRSGKIDEMILHGESKHNFAVAVMTPKKEILTTIANKLNIAGSVEEFANKVQIRSAFLSELNAYAREQGLAGFMVPKNVYFELAGFLPRGILTNTMKLIRYAARESFKEQIQAMYAQGQLKL